MISFRQFQVMFKNNQNQASKNKIFLDLTDRTINTPIELSLHKKLIHKEITAA
jgi:hypothetical protein